LGLWALFRASPGRILLAYGLFNAENLLRINQPAVLGLAVDGLLVGSWHGLGLLVLQHLGHLLLGCWRRAYDTRTFTRLYADLATDVVLGQGAAGVPVSRIAARSALSRELVTFLERDVAGVFEALYCLAGSLAWLAFLDGLMVLYCLALVVPATVLNVVFARKTATLNRRLNDQLEHEVDVINEARPAAVHRHYTALGHWRVKLADWEAFNFGGLGLFVLALLGAALLRNCARQEASLGEVLKVLGYVGMFVFAVASAPMLVQQVSRLCDISRRARQERAADSSEVG
jgi:hypothetical protein